MLEAIIRERGPLVIWENENGFAYAFGRIPDEEETGDGGDFDTLAELLVAVATPAAPKPRAYWRELQPGLRTLIEPPAAMRTCSHPSFITRHTPAHWTANTSVAQQIMLPDAWVTICNKCGAEIARAYSVPTVSLL